MKSSTVNESFIFKQIRRYNQTKSPLMRNAVLTAIGLHAGLLEKKKVFYRTLTAEEQRRVFYFIRQFLDSQDLPEVEIG